MNFSDQFNRTVQTLEHIAFSMNYELAKHPEVSGQEYKSSQYIINTLRQQGIETIEAFCDLPTAFLGRAVQVKHPKARLAILCEYDALPDVGHACGHCASGAMSVLAALTLHQMQVDGYPFTYDIDIIGTPDEEATGCKVDMVHQGVFTNYDFAIMVHLDGEETRPNSTFLALDNFRAKFYGKPAHAAGEPWNGINAVNGMQLAIHALDMLRGQVREETRIGTWMIHSGSASNVIPDYAEFECCVRHTERDYLNTISEQVKRIFEGSALATGTRVEYDFYGNSYDSMNENKRATALIETIFEKNHIPFTPGPAAIGGSSDIGNVSFQCAAMHPKLRLPGNVKVCHSKEFAEAMLLPSIEPTITTGATIIGHTLLTLQEEPSILEEIVKEFKESIATLRK